MSLFSARPARNLLAVDAVVPSGTSHGKEHMRFWVRLGLGASAALAALALASSAFSAVSPHLVVTAANALGANVTVSASDSNPADDALAKLQVYAPRGFALSRPAGLSILGSAVVRVEPTDIATGAVAMRGTVKPVALTDPRVARAGASCDKTAHSAAWLVSVNGGGNAWSFPIFVDKTSPGETAFGGTKLVACFPPVASSTHGNKFVSMTLSVRGFTVPTRAGSYLWRSLWTPYAKHGNAINAGGQVEAQSKLTIPAGVMTLRAQAAKMHTKGKVRYLVLVSGYLAVAGELRAGTEVGVVAGPSKAHLALLGSTRTNPRGQFAKWARMTRPAYFRAGVTIRAQDVGAGACAPSFGTRVPCLDATIGASQILSPIVHVKIK
jgi:hypothetical protein